MSTVTKFATSDPNLIAFLRMYDIEIGSIEKDPRRSNRMRVVMDVSDARGIELELEFRNSDFRVFSDLQRDTMDLLKRR